MPKASFIRRITSITIQVGDHIEVFELDEKENLKHSAEQRNEKIKKVKQKMQEEENASLNFPSIEMPFTDFTQIDQDEIFVDDNNNNDQKLILNTTDFVDLCIPCENIFLEADFDNQEFDCINENNFELYK
ncbi:hypothetical protein M9Y10_001472 [Tritrichomonas musculus]|uniref:Uncharacterized protein n=1 Tax=Tritrichomonas musculus TaxID=1915356 RepID=A0ABR2L732_9EUKA